MAVTRLRIRLLDFPGTDREVAEACGMPPQRISQYALGQRPIPVHHLILLCELLGCGPDEITGVYDENEFVLVGAVDVPLWAS